MSWRVDPKQNRSNGPVVTYKLTPEELEKYKDVKGKSALYGYKTPIKLDTDDEIRRRRKKWVR